MAKRPDSGNDPAQQDETRGLGREDEDFDDADDESEDEDDEEEEENEGGF
jgi:hypothetical protein